MLDNTNVIETEEEIDLREILFLFWKNLWIIILAVILGASLVFGACRYLIEPEYKATAKLYVVSASNDSVINLNDLQLGSKLALDYKELILARPMMESVLQNLHLKGMTVKELRESIEIENPGDTRILNISVTNTSAKTAAEIANEIASVAVIWLPEVMESGTPNIVEEAMTPSSPSSPHTVRYTVIGGLGFGLLLYMIIVVRFLTDDTVRTPEDMEKYLNVSPLATVPMDKKIKRKA